MADPYSEMIAAMISSKGGSDFSSNTMDPVMQYLLGNYQSAPQFTQDDLYNKFAPNIQAASNASNSSFKTAADRIKSGTPSWELWTDKNLIKSSGMNPADWKDFVESLAKENQDVLKAMMDQSMEQDVFQKAGMPGARETYLDKTPDGRLKNIATAYKFAPEQFDSLIGNLPQQEAADASRNKAIDAKYGAVFETDEKKKKKLLYDRALTELGIKEFNRTNKEPELFNPLSKVSKQPNLFKKILKSAINLPLFGPGLNPFVDRIGDSLGYGSPRDQRPFAMQQAMRELKNSPDVEDKAASARSRAYGSFLKSLQDGNVGSAADSNRRAQETALQILTSLASQGATPLKDSILSNAMLKRTTRNG